MEFIQEHLIERIFPVEPEDDNLLDVLNKNNINVWAVGKINDIFCGKGINKAFTLKTIWTELIRL